MRVETIRPSVGIPGYVLEKPLAAKYEVSVKRRGEQDWTVVLTGSYYRDRLGRTRKDITPVLPGEQRASVATVLDPVTKRILVFDTVGGTVLMDRSDPDNAAFESVLRVANFGPGADHLETRMIESYTSFAVRSSSLEIWFSDELDEALIITETARDKETNYRLFDILTKEPDASLYVPPARQTD